MEVIAKNREDYISFSMKVPVEKNVDKNGEEKDKLIELRFMDSFKFMSSSLDSLTKNLVSGVKKLFGFEEFILMSTLIPGIDLTRPSFLQ